MGERADDFEQLVAELEDHEIRRLGSGGRVGVDDAARRQRIERQVLELLRKPTREADRRLGGRIPCDAAVVVRAGAKEIVGKVIDLGLGGVQVRAPLAVRDGEALELELQRRQGSIEHGVRVKGQVAWTAGAAVGVRLAEDGDSADRRHRRFVFELLRDRITEHH